MKRSRVFFISAIVVALFSTNLISAASAAVKSTLSFTVASTPSAGESIVTFYGQVKPAGKAAITINSFNGVVWNKTSLKTTSSSSGSWKITTVATAVKAEGQYQAVATVGKKKVTSKSANFKVNNTQTFVDENTLLAGYGPGGRIHGSDISRWQHPNDKPIDFKKKFDAGMRFVLIKGSDAQEAADAETMRWLIGDRNAAQAAGLYTGMYHFAYLPDSTDLAYIQRDAKAQAQKVIWRLASLGGYNEMDLPVALDLENNCVRKNKSGVCIKYLGRTLVTAWAETWLQTVTEKTGRKPFIYSYPNFLESSMVRSEALRQYPLWLAQYGINPADPIAQPGLKTVGCYVHSWSTANCSSQWQIWQYSSCGIGSKYGVPSSRLDLNVFRGTPESFLSLIKGKWQPEPADLMPVNEPTAMNILSVASNTTNEPVEISVEVNRNIGTPVVTGTVVFRPTDATIKIKTQPAVRAASGRWLLTLTGVPAGSIVGTLNYVDQTKTHAEINLPLTLNVVQGAGLPTPTPTPKPTTTK
ncbi:MAG: lysozyme M1 (1,4-beta-N-acetylmuramidase), partial [Actinobacteria bacterium]|nr:lysozyme M1 (1,4-beta-N-acetylmuramidase) [Actinomycetota bacterium]